jgi:type III restriction enzyme
MELILESGLPHQQRAVDALAGVFKGVTLDSPPAIYANPIVPASAKNALLENITKEQHESGLSAALCSTEEPQDYLPLDIKMETGTGKTYVYTHAMFELHKTCGFNKFIVVVPSLAIKAGTGAFLEDGNVMKHFADARGYSADIEVCILGSQNAKKKGRSCFPAAVEDFVKGSYMLSHKIYVLLVNMQLLKFGTLLSKDDYDTLVEGFACPVDALQGTRPVVIIDEPHRFSRDQKAYEFLVQRIKPQCVIRFGATFPEVAEGRGRARVTRKDYRNLLYDLNACEAFNQGLVKGVTNEYFESPTTRSKKVKILRVERNDSATFQLLSGRTKKSFVLKKGDSLAVVHDAFQGISVRDIGKTEVVFSNETVKQQGEEMDVNVFMASYQEQMVKLALQRHFETERQNFSRPFKIKTLALFFIDDIYSYREGADGKPPYLKVLFEKHLKAAIKYTISQLDENESDYKEYLKYSLAHLSDCHAGYFSQDNEVSDEAIANEVSIILHGKKQLLEVKNAQGNFNVCRFLFSKWTLKEGWDNPNVFTITKLRSSGSEISKIQEVGRGLRLPVDENGNRISNEEFSLNYIVDFTDRDFADKLVKEINSQIPEAVTISEDKLWEVAKKLGMSAQKLFKELIINDYVDYNRTVNPELRDKFLSEYPDFAVGLKAGKVKLSNLQKVKKIKIRKESFDKLKDLWNRLNQRYVLLYKKEIDALLPDAILGIFKGGVLGDVYLSSQKATVKAEDGQLKVLEGEGVQYKMSNPIPYGVFLKRIANVTNIPVRIIDEALRKYVAEGNSVAPEQFNANSVAAFCGKIREWRVANLQGLLRYAKANEKVAETALTTKKGSVKKEIMQGLIGTMIDEHTPCAQYLYDTYTYDSPLERQNLLASEGIQEVIVYGKVPRKSIAIPTIAGGTFTPDFMYVVKKTDGTKELNLVVETKDVENMTDLREEEQMKIDCAKIFFQNLEAEGYTVKFHSQLKREKMKAIIDDVLA